MTNAPRAVVLVIGSPAPARFVKPRDPGSVNSRPDWRPANTIPQPDKTELRRRVAEFRELYRRQFEELKAVGAAMLRAAA